MVTVFVTGAAGFIGSHTSEQLLAAGCRVVGVDNFRSGRRENLRTALSHPAFVLREADVSEPGVFDALAREFSPSVIVHLAALVSVPESITDPVLNTRLNLTATQLLAEAARRHQVPRIVFASSAAVYGDGNGPVSPYAKAKLASEEALLGQSFTALCLRYFNVFGPRQDPNSPYSGVISIFESRLRLGRAPTVHGDGRQSRDFISVHDVARANALAATQPNLVSGAFDICTGRPTSLQNLLDHLARRYPGSKPPEFAPARPGDIRNSRGNPNDARMAMGFESHWTVEAGLDELVSRKAG